jgi:hypothetical protein
MIARLAGHGYDDETLDALDITLVLDEAAAAREHSHVLASVLSFVTTAPASPIAPKLGRLRLVVTRAGETDVMTLRA